MSGRTATALTPDPTLERLAPRVWIGGSPLRLFRLSAAGDRLLGGLARRGRWCPDGDAETALGSRLVEAGAVHPQPSVPSADKRGEVTVVVPVRDDAEGLRGLLEDLEGSGVRAVIVVDDGSRDGAAVERLVSSAGGLSLRHATARGPAAARNAGLELVDSPLVAFVDSDVRCPQGWLDPLLGHLEQPDVAAAAPRVRSARDSGFLAAHERLSGPLDLGPMAARVSPLSRVSYVPSAAILVRTAQLRSLGGFDESLRVGEDVDLVWRIVESAAMVRYEPASEVVHRTRPSLTRWVRQRYDYGTSAAALDERHPGAAAPVAVSPWSALAWTAICSGHPLSGVAVAAGTALALSRKLQGVPPKRVLALAAEGHLGAARQLTRAVIRPWWPLALGASVFSRRARRLTLAALVAEVATTRGGPADRALGLLEDLGYSSGVWVGALRSRRPGALLPRLRRWP